jgi:hypothetical protein
MEFTCHCATGGAGRAATPAGSGKTRARAAKGGTGEAVGDSMDVSNGGEMGSLE